MWKKIVFSILVLLVFAGSLFAYSISYATIDLSPDKEQIVASTKPLISVDWPYAIGARLKKAQVSLDGVDISNKIQLKDKGFDFITPNNLSQGVHVIRAKLTYDLLFTKTINLKWFFSTDTIAPKLVMNEKNNKLASRTPILGLKAKTEPMSKLNVIFNTGKKQMLNSDKKGNFVINLKGLKKSNNLSINATDRAGNVTKRRLSVLIDTIPPVVIPKSEKIIFPFDSKKPIQVYLSDKETGIVKTSLLINGKPIKYKYDEKKNLATVIQPINKDGSYAAQFDAIDVAGNKTSKKWNFKVDTSKIIVDQSDFKLYLYKNDKIIHTLNVAVGSASYPTPNGLWKVERKHPRPSWYNPHASWSKSMPPVIGPGASNPLGLRAIYLNAPGIRIHGTSKYYSIGTRASHGCMRVRNADIVGFYPKVNVGTPVLIKT